MENIKTRKLGVSDLLVTPVGLGCWQFSKQNNLAGKFWPNLEGEMVRSIVQTSLEGGINWFDTAQIYGNGASERALAKALSDLNKNPGELMIATKWWPFPKTASNISKTIGDRIHALDPFPIDLFQVHQPYGLSGVKKEMEEMIRLVNDKKIRYIGVSNFSASRMRLAWETLHKQGVPLVSNQVRYNLLNRGIESNGIMDTAKELGITLIAYSPLAQGILTGKFHDNPELLKKVGPRKYTSFFKKQGLEKSLPLIRVVRELAEKYEVTPSQVALNWLIHFHKEQVVVIPGATKESQAKENTGAMKFRLSDEDLGRLDKESTIFK
jgi:aryl-alcohol dehydrogenase-like predicted oxidoreductase